MIAIEPDRAPKPVGENVTESEQLAAGAREVPQLFVSPKSADTLIAVIFSWLDPVFVSVTGWGGLIVSKSSGLNCRLESDNTANGPVPVPDNEIICGLFPALSLIVIWPVRAPGACGLKITEMEQLEPTATLAPQLFVSEKSPLAAMLEMLSAPVP
jgi:hypothetical protein